MVQQAPGRELGSDVKVTEEPDGSYTTESSKVSHAKTKTTKPEDDANAPAADADEEKS